MMTLFLSPILAIFGVSGLSDLMTYHQHQLLLSRADRLCREHADRISQSLARLGRANKIIEGLQAACPASRLIPKTHALAIQSARIAQAAQEVELVWLHTLVSSLQLSGKIEFHKIKRGLSPSCLELASPLEFPEIVLSFETKISGFRVDMSYNTPRWRYHNSKVLPL